MGESLSASYIDLISEALNKNRALLCVNS